MKVSVLTITYNHEKYVAQAIESVLMQEVNFDYELVIGEDCSTDKTREIVVEYQKKYPNRIRLLLNEKNMGMNRNFVQTYHACKGQYIALLEGDDYWTSPQKLQKQVDFLDKHPDFVICFHNVQIIYEDDAKESSLYNIDQQEVSSIENLFSCNFINTASCLFRNKLFSKFPEWIYKLSFADWPLHILNAEYGKIMYINEAMGVYRIHKGGIWSCLAAYNPKKRIIIDTMVIEFLKIIDRHFKYKYRYAIRQALIPRYVSLIKELISEDNHKKAIFYFSQIKILDKYLNYKYSSIIMKSIIPRYVSLTNELISKGDYEKAKFYIFHLLKLGFWRNVSNRYLLIFLLWLFSPNVCQLLKHIISKLKTFKRSLIVTTNRWRQRALSYISYTTNYANLSKPSSITFDITDRCSLRCRTCLKWVPRGTRQELDIHSWEKIICSLKEWLGNYRVCISGGELFLRDDIFEIISFARKRGIYVTAVTNGYHIDASIAKKIFASGLNGIGITLNGITPATHDFTRGVKGSYEKTLRAIALLNNSKKSMFVGIGTVLMGYNQHEIIDLVKFMKEKHLDGITFQALHDSNSFQSYDINSQFSEESLWYINHPLWPKDISKMLSIVDEIIDYKKRGYSIGNSYESLEWMKHYFQNPKETLKIKCTVGINNFSIDPYGETRLCFSMSSLGNILLQKPEQIWKSRSATQQRKAIKVCKNTCRILMCNFDNR